MPVEVSIAVEARFGAEGVRDLDMYIDRAGIEIAAVDIAGKARPSRIQPLRQGPAPGRPQHR